VAPTLPNVLTIYTLAHEKLLGHQLMIRGRN
jgi:hypothetical protein